MKPLPGRTAEYDVLSGMLTAVRGGRSAVKVVLGEAGIGKTSLLDYLRASATGFQVLIATGIESDMELPFAGLQQLCAPILDARHALAAPQRAALEGAFGLSVAVETPDRFLVGLAVLGLFAEASRQQPLLVIVDDVQWLDSVSAQTLSFFARRLLAERVALVLALRTPIPDVAGLPALVVGGLSDEPARALVESVFPGRLDPAVRERIIAEARGNPLALRSIPKGLTAVDLAGGYQRPVKQSVPAELERHFRAELQLLPADTQRLLLLAAAEPVGDPALLAKAMSVLGIEPSAVTPAEDAGLITVDTTVRFHHPLARGVAYRSVTGDERRAAHAALATATDPELDPDRRAWHRAFAAEGVDAELADELETSARRARQRGGTAAAAAFLTRAVELTADPVLRGTRALVAADAHREVASFDSARRLLTTAERAPLDDLQRARLAQLRTRLDFVLARIRGDAEAMVASVDEFAAVAAQLGALDPAAATEAYLEAMSAAMYVGRHAPSRAAQVATSARAMFAATPATRTLDEVAHAMADRLALGAEQAMPAMRRALNALKQAGKPGSTEWFWLAYPVVHESLVHETWDDTAWHEISNAAVRLATEHGTLTPLPAALRSRAGAHLETGELDTAAALLDEANELAIATGHTPLKYHRLVLSAWYGDDVEANRLIASALNDAAARGEARMTGLAHYATTVLNNGKGEYRIALDAALAAFEYDDLGFFNELLIELIEAAARAGEPDRAANALAQLETRTLASGTPRALGSLARSRALLTEGVEAEALYVEAIDHFGQTQQAVHLARARLLYGEWLRRNRAATAARDQLRVAHDAFGRIGTAAFAERARRELQAAGAKPKKSPTAAGDGLTPQELQVAQLAGRGLTNQEIAVQLFISAHTVEYHLRKVFAKLHIRSRRALRNTFNP